MLKIIEDPQLLTNNSIDPTLATPQELHISQHITEYGEKLQRVYVACYYLIHGVYEINSTEKLTKQYPERF
jgi:hypothetical protein